MMKFFPTVNPRVKGDKDSREGSTTKAPQKIRGSDNIGCLNLRLKEALMVNLLYWGLLVLSVVRNIMVSPLFAWMVSTVVRRWLHDEGLSHD